MAEAMLPAAAPRIEDGVWVSRTQPRALLVASTRADGADLDAQQAAQSLVRERFAALAAAGPAAGTLRARCVRGGIARHDQGAKSSGWHGPEPSRWSRCW